MAAAFAWWCGVTVRAVVADAGMRGENAVIHGAKELVGVVNEIGHFKALLRLVELRGLLVPVEDELDDALLVANALGAVGGVERAEVDIELGEILTRDALPNDDSLCFSEEIPITFIWIIIVVVQIRFI